MTRRPSPRPTPRRTVLAALVSLTVAADPAAAGTVVWAGTGFGNGWAPLQIGGNVVSNWTRGGSTPTALRNGDDLLFTGNLGLVNTNDVVGLHAGSLSFDAGAGPFVVDGEELVLDGNLTSASPQHQTLNLRLRNGRSGAVWDGGKGRITVDTWFWLDDRDLTLSRGIDLTARQVSFTVGDAAAAHLRVQGGSTVKVDQGFVGLNGAGQLTVDQPGSRVESTNTLEVGVYTQGRIDVTGGGVLQSPTALVGSRGAGNGTVVVSGTTSRWRNSGKLTVGAAWATGAVEVRHGAQLDSGAVDVGVGSAFSVGQARVSGADARWESTGALVLGGRGGVGDLTVDGAGTFVGVGGTIGSGTGSVGTALVIGSGSLWDSRGTLNVGQGGTGTLRVEQGGHVAATGLAAGVGSGGQGTVRVSNSGSQLSVGDLAVGTGWGVGQLTMLDRAQLVSARSVIGGGVGNSSSSGEVRLDTSARWDNSQYVNLGGSDRGGRLVIAGNAQLKTLALNLRQGAVLVIDGGVLDAGEISSTGIRPADTLQWTTGTVRLGSDTGLETLAPKGLSLTPGQNLEVKGVLRVPTSAPLHLAGGHLQSGRVDLLGGLVTSASGAWRLDGSTGNLSGFGTVAAALSGEAGRSITGLAGQSLILGDSKRSDGFDFDGHLVVAGSVALHDADVAELGYRTDLADGSRLGSTHGVHVGDGSLLVAAGYSTITDGLRLDGLLDARGAVVTLQGLIDGSGSLRGGELRFEGGHQPGAATDFGGGVARYLERSILTLDIGGVAPGSFDALRGLATLEIAGRLVLDFAPGASFSSGERLQLFDTAGFAGTMDAGRIVVTGFDRQRLDFSQLWVDGTLGVTAVPEPAVIWMWLAGGLATAASVRRRPRRPGRASG